MRVLPVFPKNWFSALLPALETHGVELVSERPEAIIIGSISQLSRALEAIEKYPNVSVYAYCWDLYEWSKRDRCYDYARWGRILKHAREVWHPSECTLRRAKEWYGLTNGHVIKTFVPVSHLGGCTPRDDGYVLVALRESPDPGHAWIENACLDLGIPLVATRLGQPQGKFIETLAGATLLVNPLREASTGGLFLVEGLYLGKSALVSASPWNAGRDYVGPFCMVPKVDSYDAFVSTLELMWRTRQAPDLAQAREFVRQEYSLETMAKNVLSRL